METITDLTATVSELLGTEVPEDTVRAHATAPYSDYDSDTALDALCREVWADVSDGAEWPWD